MIATSSSKKVHYLLKVPHALISWLGVSMGALLSAIIGQFPPLMEYQM
jgi:hypothetical protein